MYKHIRLLKMAIAGFGLALSVSITNAADSKDTTIAQEALSAPPMPSEELFYLYVNRSWLWDKSAGYFANKRREFTSADFSEESYGQGKWFIPRPGKLCFRADWHGNGGSANALTCFQHHKADGKIYQKRLPDGEWYVFKNNPTRRYDEYRKLRRGDYVRKRLSRLTARKK